jgi:hypothetical protein
MRVQNERETCAGLYREATEMHVTGLGARGGEVPWKSSAQRVAQSLQRGGE